MRALIENPDQLARLRDNMDLMPLAVEGDDPLGHPGQGFMRTATADTEVRRGEDRQRAKAFISLTFPATGTRTCSTTRSGSTSARPPNKHVAFGYGVHFCLGAALARMEMNSFFTELVPRLKSVELAGPPAAVGDDVRRRAQAPADPLRDQLSLNAFPYVQEAPTAARTLSR